MFSTLDIICEIHTFKISLLKDHGVSLNLKYNVLCSHNLKLINFSLKVAIEETRLEFFLQLALEITSRRESLWTHNALGNIFYLDLSH